MNWRNRTVNDKLDVEKITIYKFYKEQYKKGLFCVNRRYQRKLVWTLEEKKELIDTIFRKYPIPMFLISSYKEDYKSPKMEIIDGLQRIDAIVSFINGDYPVEFREHYGYFNLDAFTGYGKLIRENIMHQEEPALPLELCEKFLDYELPFSITGSEDSEVEEIFRRINSTGRKLSKQDLRQAGVSGYFSDLVRRTAAYIRGDYTEKNVVDFADISKYSLNNKELPYGIDIDSIFWVSQGVLQEGEIRRSKDEEIIAHIYVYLLTKGKYPSSFSTLESVYDVKHDMKRRLDESISSEEKILYWMEVFAKSTSVINDACKDINFLQTLFGRDNVYNKDYSFIIVFCAITDLFLSGMTLRDSKKFKKTLKLLGVNELGDISLESNSRWNKDIRNRLIERVKHVLKPHFSYLPEGGEMFAEWDVRMVNFLERAEVEEQMYDFKAGVTDYKKGAYNGACVSKIVQTLAAMVNTIPREYGYVLLGVTDCDSDAEYISKKLHTETVRCKKFEIIGIKDEADKYYDSVDMYLSRIKEAIKNEPVSDSFKNEILTKCHPVEYKGKLLYLFMCKSDNPVYYNKSLFVRYGSSNHLIENGSEEFNTAMRRFYQINQSSI